MRTLLVTLGAAGALAGIVGCQDLTSVDAPDVIQDDDYTTPAGATTLAAGAITWFHLAFGGGTPDGSQVAASGRIADELTDTGTGNEWDLRKAADPSASEAPYAIIQVARQRLLTAVGAFQQAAPDSSARIGQLFALVGYTSVFFAENFCAGVPLSHRDADLQPVYGQPLTTVQLFDSALAAFDSALVYGADSTRIVDLARVGKGRALLNQGRFSEAAEAVAGVPTTYVYNVTFVTNTLNNGLFNTADFPQRFATIPDREGINGINWRTAVGDSAPDPRTPLVFLPPSSDGPEVWQFAQYQASDAPIPLAGGIEARLIEAEAALQVGDAATWLARHNELRATVPGLDPLVDPGAEAARVDLHFRERAFWLFLTGHRHGDLRRLVRQYGRGAETVFPTGVWQDGVQVYESATSMAPPATETNNPNYTGCLDRNA